MGYLIKGLSPETFSPLFELDHNALAVREMKRVTAISKPGYPCRVSLQDAEQGAVRPKRIGLKGSSLNLSQATS